MGKSNSSSKQEMYDLDQSDTIIQSPPGVKIYPCYTPDGTGDIGLKALRASSILLISNIDIYQTKCPGFSAKKVKPGVKIAVI
jgi:hypothetical protein